MGAWHNTFFGQRNYKALQVFPLKCSGFYLQPLDHLKNKFLLCANSIISVCFFFNFVLVNGCWIKNGLQWPWLWVGSHLRRDFLHEAYREDMAEWNLLHIFKICVVG